MKADTCVGQQVMVSFVEAGALDIGTGVVILISQARIHPPFLPGLTQRVIKPRPVVVAFTGL